MFVLFNADLIQIGQPDISPVRRTEEEPVPATSGDHDVEITEVDTGIMPRYPPFCPPCTRSSREGRRVCLLWAVWSRAGLEKSRCLVYSWSKEV